VFGNGISVRQNDAAVQYLVHANASVGLAETRHWPAFTDQLSPILLFQTAPYPARFGRQRSSPEKRLSQLKRRGV
jgi:hypothetical protein